MEADIQEVLDLKKRKGMFGLMWASLDAMYEKETDIGTIEKQAADYDLIIIGSPIWARRLTPAVITYLKRTDLSGKKVAVFFAQSGKRRQGTDQIRALMPKANYLGELAIDEALRNQEESEKQILLWCNQLKEQLNYR